MSLQCYLAVGKECGNYRKTINLTDDDEYTVTCNVSNSDKKLPYMNSTSYYKNLKLTIEWKKKLSKEVRVYLYNYPGTKMLDNRIHFISDQKYTGTFVYSYECFFRVEIIPCFPMEVNDNSVSSAIQFKKPLTEVISVKTEPVLGKKLDELSTDMQSLLQKGNFSDVVLTDGSNEIPAHRLILSLRSSVFAKMLEIQMKENRENLITIKDIHFDVLKEFLHFIYTGIIAIKDMRMARDLYMAADKYDVKDLKCICSEMLKSIDLSNVLDTLLLADLHDDHSLKQTAMAYISENFSHVKTLENWSDFMKQKKSLAIEILSFVVDKKLSN